jgi:hypothetical protein
MYEGYIESSYCFSRENRGIFSLAGFVLSSCGLGWNDCLFYLVSLVNPIIDGDLAFCVLFYLIGQAKAGHLSIPKDIVKSRGAYAQFLGYTALFLVIELHPLCEFIHIALFFYFFLWTKMRSYDTFGSITRIAVENKPVFLKVKSISLTYIARRVTI